jgi:class 3 adenylate cyclase
MAAGRYDQRVQDLLGDAAEAAQRHDWVAVRALAGAALALAPDQPDAVRLLADADQHAPAAGERRQLTVMFCDVVGSTTLSEQQDPELVGEVLRSYQVTCDRVVRRYGGRIARFIGDGILAYFGHPVAHEADARRGVKAGLELLEALRPVSQEIGDRYGIDLRVRVAVHTGLIVRAAMGSAATPDRDAIVGDTPNIAARLQDHAAPGTLVISDDTYELVRGWFLVAPLGELHLKGIGRPLPAYQVVDEATDDGLVYAQADLSPFVCVPRSRGCWSSSPRGTRSRSRGRAPASWRWIGWPPRTSAIWPVGSPRDAG